MGPPPIEGGWVRIDRGRIVAVGRGRPTGRVVDLGDAIILPGLVNAHTHLEFSDLTRPLPLDGGLVAWIDRVVSLRRSRATGDREEARRAAAVAAGLRESAAAGVTAVGEIATAPLPRHVAAGPRLRTFHETLGLSGAAMAVAGTTLHRGIDLLGGAAGGVSPHAPYSVGAALGRLAIAVAVRRRLPVAMHIAETREEAELVATGGGSFRGLLDRLGAWPAHGPPPRLLPAADWISLLARAWRGVVVHGTFLPEDAAGLARLTRHRRRLCVVVCPRTTRAVAGVLPPVAVFREAGVRVAIGTDSRASNPDLSILAECRELVAGGGVGPAEAISMATRDAAWAVGFEHRCGRLACGRPADVAVLRPAISGGDPFAAALDPGTRVVATLRAGRLIAGRLS